MNELKPSIPSPAAPLSEAVSDTPGATLPTGYVTPALLRWQRIRSAGKVRPMVLLWALGVPIPILLIIFLARGCS